jgi:glutathione peroxidase-family protein
MRVLASLLCLLSGKPFAASFVHHPALVRNARGASPVKHGHAVLASSPSSEEPAAGRRSAIACLLAGGGSLLVSPAADAAAVEDSSFEDIASRANQISKDLDKQATQTIMTTRKMEQTAYDFSLPVEGRATPFRDIIRQETSRDGDLKVKAILVVNIKQDDVVARKTIPGLIELASKYGRGYGGLAVVACPTDQGYYEPDTSQLIRLKLASEYGYGINPSTLLTDKVNLLGTGAHPFWRWLESTCRTPAGIGRIEGNFEKFLLDGRSGYPLRRYPRKYSPSNIAEDIEAVIAGRPLPPARANWLEEWRTSAVEAENNTYRFEKGLNVFDQ